MREVQELLSQYTKFAQMVKKMGGMKGLFKNTRGTVACISHTILFLQCHWSDCVSKNEGIPEVVMVGSEIPLVRLWGIKFTMYTLWSKVHVVCTVTLSLSLVLKLISSLVSVIQSSDLRHTHG